MSVLRICDRKLQGLLTCLFAVCSGVAIFLAISNYVLQDFQHGPKQHFNLANEHVNTTQSATGLHNSDTGTEEGKFEIPDPSLEVEALTFDKDCDERFNETLEDNLRVIENYPSGIASRYMWKLGVNFSKPINNKEYPVLVTAISRKFYPLSQGMFKTFYENILSNKRYGGNMKVIIYDIGLTRRQHKVMQTAVRCEIRKFPFEEFPPHVKERKYYAWKPLIIQMMLVEFGFVWWADASVRFKHRNVDAAYDASRKHGIIFNVSPAGETYSLTKQTDVGTFTFLGEDRCKFKHFAEAQTYSLIVHFNPVSSLVIRAWAKCALNKNCIAPAEAKQNVGCDVTLTFDGRCHRFDQSVLGIIMRRVYHKKDAYYFNEVLNEFIEVKPGDDSQSFSEKCYGVHCYV